MEIVPEKNRKRQSKFLILIIILMMSIPFIIDKFSKEQIEDKNEADTAIVTFNIEDFYTSGDGCVGYKSSLITSGSSSKKDADIDTTVDFDTVYYTFEKFSGMKVIQETEVTDSVSFSIISQIESGNFEIAVFKDSTFLKVFNTGENTKITFSDAGIYTIVIGGESTKGTVGVQRKF